MAIKFSQFNLRTESTPTMYLVGYDGNQNIHITVDNLISNIIDGTEDTIAMFGPGGNNVIDSMLSQNAGATILTIGGQLNVDAAATFDTSITVTGNSTLNGNVTLGNASTDLITQTGTLYLNGPVKDTTDTLGDADQILVSDANGELTFTDLTDITVGSAEVVQVPVKNLEGSPLTKGDPVYISGSVGASGRLEVKLADASNEAKMPALGLLKQDLGVNGTGFAVVTGKLRNLPTDPIDGQTPLENDVIYVKANGTTGAALTLTKPTGSNLIQNMGKVGRVSTSNDGTFVVSSILRTNDIPNLTPGKIWVGSTGNTIESSSITFTEASGAVQLNEYGAGTHTGTVAKNLAVDVDGNVIETGAAVDGSGTANYTARWIDTDTLGTGVLYDNGTNVGIGTTDPQEKLHVVGNTKIEGVVIVNSANSSLYIGSSSTGQSSTSTGDRNVVIGPSAFGNNTSARYNTAVGHAAMQDTTTGDYNSVLGNQALKNNIDGGYSVAVGSQSLAFNTNSGNNTAVGYRALYQAQSGSNTGIGQGAFNSLQSSTSSGDNTGIGQGVLNKITSGQRNVGVGNAAGQKYGGTNNNVVTANDSVFIGADSDAGGDNQTNQIVIGYNAIGLGSNTAVLGNNSIATTQLKGDVGIGTTNPEYALHVDPTVKIGDRQGTDGSLILQSQQGPNITFTSSGNDLNISGATGSSNGNTIKLLDNIKLFEFSPNIGGTIKIRRGNRGLMDTNFGGFVVEEQATTGSNGRSTFLSTDTNGTILRSTSYGSTGTGADIQFQFGGGDNTSEPAPATKMIIKNSGNVGIGTTDPSEKLHVSGNARVTGAYYDSTNSPGTSGQILSSTATGTDWIDGSAIPGVPDGSGTAGKIVMWQDSDTLTDSKITQTAGSETNYVDVDFANVEDLTITGDSGFSTFTVNGFDAVNFTGIENNFNVGSGNLSIAINDSSMSLGTPTADSDTLTVGYPTTRFIGSGNVGIGTTDPVGKLHVKQAATNGNNSPFANPHVKLTATATADNQGFVGITTATSTADNYGYSFGAQRTSGGVGDFKINYHNNSSQGVNRFIIDQNGNVGIGTDDPTNELTIESVTPVIDIKSTTTFPSGQIRFLNSGGNEFSGIQAQNNPGTSALILKYVTPFLSSLSSSLQLQGGNLFLSTANSERMRITSTGNVGIGLTNPSYQLQLSTNSAAKPTSSSWTVVSDERVKTNIRPYETGLQELLQIEPKLFDYNGKAGFDTKAKNNIGVIAQEIKDIMPETVKKYNTKLNEEDEEDTELYNFDSHALTFALINSVKELNAKIENLESIIQTLENQ